MKYYDPATGRYVDDISELQSSKMPGYNPATGKYEQKPVSLSPETNDFLSQFTGLDMNKPPMDMPRVEEEVIQPTPEPKRMPASNPVPEKIKEVLKAKYASTNTKEDPFSDKKREALKESASKEKENLGWLQALTGVGNAFAGKGAEASNNYFNGLREQIDAQSVGDFDRRKKQSKEDAVFKRQQDQFDPNSTASQSFRKIIETNFPNVAKAYGEAWQEVSAADQDAIFRPLQLKETIEARKQQHALMSQIRNEDKRAKAIADERELEVPGFLRDARIKPTASEATKARSALASMKTLSQSLDRMDQLVKANGSFEFGGNSGAEMETLNTTIQMNLKNLYELGALSGPDMAIIQSQLNDPTSLKALFSRDSSVRGGIGSLKSQLNSGFMNGMQSKGYVARPEVAEGNSPQREMKAPYGDVVEQGGVTYKWNPVSGKYE